MVLPSVDVVIPTLNCATSLEECLRRIRAQTYSGKVNVIIVDAGSTDSTLEVAKSYEATVFVNVGQPPDGLTGARNFGIAQGTSELVWLVDSDNLVVEPSVLAALVEPLAQDASVWLSIPVTSIDPSASALNNYLSRVEILGLETRTQGGVKIGEWRRVSDLNYGLPNCCMIRRAALKKIGGHDSDVRVLSRLRRAGLAKAVIVLNAHFYHNQTRGALHYYRKLLGRFSFYAGMTDGMAQDYFAEPFPSEAVTTPIKARSIGDILIHFWLPFRQWLKTHETGWRAGMTIPFIYATLVLLHPVKVWRAYARVFSPRSPRSR